MANSGGMLCIHGSNRRNLPYPDLDFRVPTEIGPVETSVGHRLVCCSTKKGYKTCVSEHLPTKLVKATVENTRQVGIRASKPESQRFGAAAR
ncbi:hypothetical protein RRG08_030422 [Elysia crispata]|uniref:Uncharacterized protein n=1 Tax=Elysia crispata TaxID=231223 RepID=A0AAE0YFV4_9GAST|nr:hypothetical protein RRG08_030422 [Elysia crispata]